MTVFRFHVLVFIFLVSSVAQAKTLRAGPGERFKTPCAAIEAAGDGDLILIQGGVTYGGDVCTIRKDNLTIRGVGGRAHIDAAGKSEGGKAIWVIAGANTTVENIEFSGCRVRDKNGAGIRQEGPHLTVRNCYFHDNENGILAGGGDETRILIEYSEFARNGANSYAHNMYIGGGIFTLRHCYSHDTHAGHLVKSRARENYILYNRLTNREGGSSDYEIDLPNGGLAYVVGNVLQQTPHLLRNDHMLSYGVEGFRPGYEKRLFVVNNTFVDDYRSKAPFLAISKETDVPPVVKNNAFVGVAAISAGVTVDAANNYVGENPGFRLRAAGDYRPRADSVLVDAGADPGFGDSFDLTPKYEHAMLTCRKARPRAGSFDIGAFEYWEGATGATEVTCGVELGIFALDPSTLLVAAATGDQAPGEKLRVEPLGSGTGEWAVECRTFSGGDWLNVSPRESVGASDLDVTFSNSILGRGTYLGEIRIRSVETGGVAVVPVVLTVNDIEPRRARPGLRGQGATIH